MDKLGIVCYTSESSEKYCFFKGFIKRRPEDFVVTELDSSGCQVSLTSGEVKEVSNQEEVLGSENLTVCSSDVMSPSCVEKEEEEEEEKEYTAPFLSTLVDDDMYQQLHHAAVYCDNTTSSPINLGIVMDKVRRKDFHQSIRQAFPQLCSTTNEKKEIIVSIDGNYNRLKSILGHEDSCRLLKYVNVDGSKQCDLLLELDSSREHRAEVHHTIGELYGNLLVTHTRPPVKRSRFRTECTDSGQQIVINFRPKKTKAKKLEEDFYTKFVLCKENMESLDAINILSRVLSCHVSQFAYAGVKDTRAITTQTMTVRYSMIKVLSQHNVQFPYHMIQGISPSQLASIGPLPNLTIGNLQSVRRHITLGEHSGNHFKIRIRNFCPLKPLEPNSSLVDVVQERIQSLKDNGMVNYYGAQRFGYNKQYPNGILAHQIGLAILQRNHMNAVDLLLSPNDGDDEVQIAKRYFTRTKDAAGALKLMPHQRTREQLVLKALYRYGYSENGCTRALCSIPYNSRKLYLHSYSSLLWNYLTSFRIKEYGLCPVAGDLILKSSQKPEGNLRDAVYMLTEEDIQSGKYSVRDIVLPTVGTATILPGNKVADRLKSLLSGAQLTCKSFKLKKLNMSSSGSYRHIIHYPEWIKWNLVRENETTVQDKPIMDETSSKQPEDDTTTGKHRISREEKEENVDIDETECRVSHNLELEFTLTPSTYATIFLRELIGID